MVPDEREAPNSRRGRRGQQADCQGVGGARWRPARWAASSSSAAYSWRAPPGAPLPESLRLGRIVMSSSACVTVPEPPAGHRNYLGDQTDLDSDSETERLMKRSGSTTQGSAWLAAAAVSPSPGFPACGYGARLDAAASAAVADRRRSSAPGRPGPPPWPCRPRGSGRGRDQQKFPDARPGRGEHHEETHAPGEREPADGEQRGPPVWGAEPGRQQPDLQPEEDPGDDQASAPAIARPVSGCSSAGRLASRSRRSRSALRTWGNRQISKTGTRRTPTGRPGPGHERQRDQRRSSPESRENTIASTERWPSGAAAPGTRCPAPSAPPRARSSRAGTCRAGR